jgi:hypothetical protein
MNNVTLPMEIIQSLEHLEWTNEYVKINIRGNWRVQKHVGDHSTACQLLLIFRHVNIQIFCEFFVLFICFCGLGSSVGIATDYGMDGLGIESWCG